jgi:hypothetical protein
MKTASHGLKAATAALTLLAILSSHTLVFAGNGNSDPAGSGNTDPDPHFDTSFAVEYSDSCLSAGCHETDSALLQEYAASFMTHAMVKCNACHGTHTAESVGDEKPNLTGYYEGIGATGYRVGDDRCIACHSDALDSFDHPNKTWDCVGCHTPHRFSAVRFGRY